MIMVFDRKKWLFVVHNERQGSRFFCCGNSYNVVTRIKSWGQAVSSFEAMSSFFSSAA